MDGTEVVVQAVYFSGRGATVTGGTTDVTVRIEPNKSGTPSVGGMEEFSGGTGNMWKSSVWLAAFNATRAVGTCRETRGRWRAIAGRSQSERERQEGAAGSMGAGK